MKPNNPFLISGYYSPEFFCDREQRQELFLMRSTMGAMWH